MTKIFEEVVDPPVIPTVKNPPERKRRRWRTLIALSFGYFVDQGENQAMSIFSPVLKSLWSLTNMNLAWITFIRSLLQSLSSPVWGFLSDRHSRKKVLLIGTGLWGIWTIIVGFTKTYEQLILIRVISGLGLGCLMPATFSIMADTFKPSIRGRMLGIMEAIGVLGMIVFTMGMGFLATPDMWRYGFFILGVASIISGFVIWFFVDEPVRGEAEPEMRGQITQEDAEKYKAKFSDIKKVLKIPTIWVAIGQGLAGSMPWVVMGAFLILWLVEVRGVPTTSAPLVFGGVVIGTALSNILGGIIGDYAAKVNPKYGRAFIGQFSVFIGIPFTYFLFTKTQDWSMLQLAILCFVTALLISWPGKGAKEPMMQGVVPPELRATAFSMTTFIESGFAAIAALIFGIIADKIDISTAMVWTVPFPWIICGLLFTGFYFTYPKDSKKLRDEMQRRAIELGISQES